MAKSRPTHMKTALITGCSSGIGLHAAVALAEAGYATYGTMRDTTKSGALLEVAGKKSLDIRVIPLDVDRQESVRDAVARVADESGRVDVLVNNAGYGQFGALEDIKVSDFRAQFETNFFGTVSVIREVLPYMRAQKSGRIINVGSVAGRMGLPCSPAYISSKFAVEGLTECLRYELDQFGIQVTVIEPGVVKTSFFDSMCVPEYQDGPYQKLTSHILGGLRMMVQMGTEPARVADAILRAAQDEEMPPRYVVGQDAAMFMEARRSKSDVEFERYMKKEMFPQ